MVNNDTVDTTPGPLAASMSGEVSCSACGELLKAGDIVRNVPVYSLGELDYIEIVHDTCAGRASCPDCGGVVQDVPEGKAVACTRCEWAQVEAAPVPHVSTLRGFVTGRVWR